MKNFLSILRVVVLFPLSQLYSMIVYIRNRLYDYQIGFRSQEFDTPVITIGNITVGGTGKTPHLSFLLSHLGPRYRTAALSRGYRRRTKGFVLADETTGYKEIGDEPKMIKSSYPDVIVAVDEKRVRGIKKLESLYGGDLDIILLDDAFQHRRVKAGLSILLIDYTQPMYHDHILPYGRLRESHHEKRRASIIIITNTPESLKPIDKRILIKNIKLYPYQKLYFTRIEYLPLRPLSGSITVNQVKLLLATGNVSILAVSGIARPQNFQEYLRKQYSSDIRILEFRDHHTFRPKDIQLIHQEFDAISNPNKLIITTEKDAIRFTDPSGSELMGNLPVTFLPIRIVFMDGEEEHFLNQLTNYVDKNKRNSRLHKERSKMPT
jgi:tetraacyldisaccharide 4'-kinase